MGKASDKEDVPQGMGYFRTLSILLWLAIGTGWAVSVFSVIEEMCMVSACRDTASFTFFGLNMGLFGIFFFSLILILLWLRTRFCYLDLIISAMVFSAVGAELRLLWIQKFVIGGWCPLCVTICCAIFVAAILLIIVKVRWAGLAELKSFLGWLALVLVMSVAGLAIAIFGVKALY